MIYPDSVTTSCGAHFVTILFLSNYRTAVTIELQYQLVKGIEEALYSYRVRDGLRKEVSVLLCKVIELPEVYIGANRWHSIPNKRFLLWPWRFTRRNFWGKTESVSDSIWKMREPGKLRLWQVYCFHMRSFILWMIMMVEKWQSCGGRGWLMIYCREWGWETVWLFVMCLVACLGLQRRFVWHLVCWYQSWVKSHGRVSLLGEYN